jgi:hypothetical protein
MAQLNCMTKYPDHSPPNDVLKETSDMLEFPVAPDFVSHPPQIDPQAMLQRIAETVVWRSQRPGEAERRLAEKIAVEFVL